MKEHVIYEVKRNFGMVNEDNEVTLTDYNYVPRKDASRETMKHYGVRAGAVLMLILLVVFSGNIKNAVVAMLPDSSEPGAQDIFVENIRREIASKPKFEAEVKNSYQDTYAENVLHFQKYNESFLDQQWQDKRLSDLNNYFFDELKLDENVVVRFIAEEKILIRELLELRNKINPRFVQEGITRMKQRELKSRKKFIEMLGGTENYNKFRMKDKNFFQ